MSDDSSTPPTALMKRLSFLLKQAFALMDEATERELAQLSVSGREFAVLTLVDAEGAASQQGLAGRIGVDRTTMAALIDALEEKQLVSRSGRIAIDGRERRLSPARDVATRPLAE